MGVEETTGVGTTTAAAATRGRSGCATEPPTILIASSSSLSHSNLLLRPRTQVCEFAIANPFPPAESVPSLALQTASGPNGLSVSCPLLNLLTQERMVQREATSP